MSATTLCLSFVHLVSSSLASPPPPNIQQLLQNRIAHQWRQRGHSQYEIRFDDSKCEIFGNYSYTERSIVLTADNDAWRGPLELGLTGALEGERIPFERISKDLTQAEYKKMNLVARSENKTEWKKWVPWTLAVVAVVGASYLLIERHNHARELQGLTITF